MNKKTKIAIISLFCIIIIVFSTSVIYYLDLGDNFESNYIETNDEDIIDENVNDTKTPTTPEKKPVLMVLDHSDIWIRDDNYYKTNFDEDKPVWFGDISMTLRNDREYPVEIAYAKIETIEKIGEYPLYQASIYFSFTYTYEKVVENNDDGEGGMLGSELVLEAVSNNTQVILPGETVTLNSNLDLTYLSWNASIYPVRVWIYEKKDDRTFSHTMYENVIELV